MSADFWAGYIAGAVGILIGNPLDVLKVRLQAGSSNAAGRNSPSTLTASARQLATGTAAPVLGLVGSSLNCIYLLTAAFQLRCTQCFALCQLQQIRILAQLGSQCTSTYYQPVDYLASRSCRRTRNMGRLNTD